LDTAFQQQHCDALVASGQFDCTNHFETGMPYAGYCSLMCNVNQLDAVVSAGYCAASLASGGISCANDYCNDCPQQGMCDWECGLCTPADAVIGSRTQAPAPPDLRNVQSLPPLPAAPLGGPCSTNNELDEDAGQGTCRRMIASGIDCDTHFSYGAVFAGYCEGICGFNVLDTQRGRGQCQQFIAAGLSCADDFCDECSFAGMCDFHCGLCGSNAACYEVDQEALSGRGDAIANSLPTVCSGTGTCRYQCLPGYSPVGLRLCVTGYFMGGSCTPHGTCQTTNVLDYFHGSGISY
jgi:hypothetical protein